MADQATHASAIAGVQAMEDQHEMVVDSLSSIGLQLTRGQSSARLCNQIELLIEFTGMHFGCEESLLRRHGYPRLEEHCRAHQDLLSQIRLAGHRAECGEDAELERLLASVRGNYLDHIDGLDRDYSRWLNSRGVD